MRPHTFVPRGLLPRAHAMALAALTIFSTYACSGEVDGMPELAGAAQGIDLNPGFQHEVVATGFRNPTAMTIAPDGRVFIAQQTGEVRVVKDRTLLATPFVKLSVDSGNERGLVGIALDPAFAQNGFLYVFYTVAGGAPRNRVSRFTAEGDVARAGSELVLVDFPALGSASNHNAGALLFGADGKLYVAHGDNADDRLAQDLNHPFGSILRFNADGSIPADNPFFEQPVDVADAIWAYGLRNPFTMAVSRAGRIFANDVGGGGPEEVNDIVRAGNYGHGGGPSPIAPVHSYPRVGRCAITGGTFYEPSVLNFPSSYVGKYFFADYCAGEIWHMNADGTGVTSFARVRDGHLHNPVDLDVGLDGSLYYLQRGNGEKLSRIFVPQAACTGDAECSDRNVCNGQERCVGGQCQGGAPLTCDDGNACTSNTCHASMGCQFADNGQCNCNGDAECNDGSSCTDDRCVSRMCEHRANGSCGESPIALTYVGGGEGFGTPLSLTDGNLDVKVASATTPSCLEYSLPGAHTVTSARLMEDNAGNWRVDTWKVQVDDGSGFRDAVGYSDSPRAMPQWNELALGSIGNVRRVKVCLASAGMLEASELQVLGRASTTTPVCGDLACQSGESCASCAQDCGACPSGPIALTRLSDGGGFDNVAGLTDGNLTVKVSTATSPNCLEYALPSPHTVRSARLLEDNDGSWHVDTWSLWLDRGTGYQSAFESRDTPRAMPLWNEVDIADVSDVTRVRVCLANNGPLEAAELQLLGEPSAPAVCGDQACTGSETCSSCPWDCQRCAGMPGLDAREENLGCVAGSAADAPPVLLSEHPCVESLAGGLTFVQGVLPYQINQPFWSDGAEKARFFALPDGASLSAQADGDLTLPPGAVTIKHFGWQGMPFETRFFVRHDEGSYGAYTYRWNDALDDAELVDGELGAERTLPGGLAWSYPRTEQCFTCHQEAAGFSLGLELRQLARDAFYPSSGRTADQILTLSALGMLGAHASVAPLPALDEPRVSLEARARAYLHVNCSYCHRPGGSGYGLADYRIDTSLGSMRVCDEPSILAAYAGFDLLEPGAHERSVIWLRASTRGEAQMPPLGSRRPDSAGQSVLADFIDQLATCP